MRCVGGIVSSVFVTTSAIFSSPILRGAPQRLVIKAIEALFGKPLSPSCLLVGLTSDVIGLANALDCMCVDIEFPRCAGR
jgi:hypothetical protein